MSNESLPWKWSIALIDDNPGDLLTVRDDLEKLEVRVRCFGRTNNEISWNFLFDPTESELVKECALLFVDLEWETITLEPILVNLAFLEKNDISLSEKMRLFVQRFTTEWEGDEKPLPNEPIADDDKGFWLGTALSYLCPHSVICFFTNRHNKADLPITAALRMFSQAPIKIQKKQLSEHKILQDDFFIRMEDLQRKVLRDSMDALEWFIERVFIPTLIGKEPYSGTLWKFWEGDNSENLWSVTAESFFPQWNTWKQSNNLKDELIKFISHQTYTLSPVKKGALYSIQHDISNVLKSKADPLSNIEKSIKTSFDGGEGTEPLRELLKGIKEDIKKNGISEFSREQLADAIKKCNLILENGLRQLDDLCIEYDGKLACSKVLESYPNSLSNEIREVTLPFDFTRFKRVVEALHTNSQKYGHAKNFALNGYWDGKTIRIEWLDDSTGFSRFRDAGLNEQNQTNHVDESFVGKVYDSIAKGRYRGLPLALTFPFFYPVIGLSVLISNKWEKIYLSLEENNKIDANIDDQRQDCFAPANDYSKWRFGVRWVFDLPESEKTRI